MARKSQTLKPDTILKNYWRSNERFADLFNAVLFQGQQIIKPEELEDIDTEESSILEHKDYAETIEASRDNIKIRKRSSENGIEFVMLGKEAQKHIHYAMPLRIMGYDYGTYKKQYDDNASKYKSSQGMDPDEYLSRMKQTDRFTPVVTVVVYYSEKPWNGATTLHEMLRIPKEFAAYVNDYKMILVEARKNEFIFHNADNVDFFRLMEIILNPQFSRNEARKKAIQYSEEHQTSKSVVMAIAGAAESKIDYNAFEKGDGRMCTLFDTIAKESEFRGKSEGKAEGKAEEIIETGYEFGLSENDILERLQRKLNVSLQKAQEYFNTFAKQTI